MAIIGRHTLNNIEILEFDADPSVSGVDAPLGSFGSINNGGGVFLKTSAPTTGWVSAGSLPSGVLDQVLQNNGSTWVSIYPEALLQPSHAFNISDDFICATTTGNLNWLNSVTGTGAAVSIVTSGIANNHLGQFQLTTGTTTTGYSNLRLGTSHILLGGGLINIEFDILTSTLGISTDQYAFRCGLGDTTTNADQVNGVYFEYAQGVNGNFWVGKTASGSSRNTITPITSTVTATTWYRLSIQINAAASSVSYYVNGTLIGTLSATIPTTLIAPFIMIGKSAGTAARTVNLDYFYMNQRFTTQRG
jgi:hypothetical protein